MRSARTPRPLPHVCEALCASSTSAVTWPHSRRSTVMIHETKANYVVLVIDDSPDSLRFLTDALDSAGMTVLVATDGEEALARVNEVRPDVVLLDALMPGLDGFETCRRMKADPRFRDLPVIFMTALS